MNRDTIIRIAIPTALYESVKGKVLNEEINIPDPKVDDEYETQTGVRFTITNVDNDYVTLVVRGMVRKMKIDKFKEFTEKKYHKPVNPSTIQVNEAKKPSAGMTKKEKSAVVKKAKAGKDIGKKGKGFAAVEKKAKESGAENPKAVAAAAMWKSQAATKEGIKDIFTKKSATKQKGKTIIPKGDKKLDMKVFDDETAKKPIYNAEKK
jgi:hypothetical protein